MNCIETPLNIEVLMHSYTTPGPHPRSHAPAVRDSLKELCAEGAIEPDGEAMTELCFRATEKGKAWIAAICAVPPPIQAWKDGKTGELIEL